jgi:hypothetical protein
MHWSTPVAKVYTGQAAKSMQPMNMMHTTTLYTSLLHWMKSGWMQKGHQQSQIELQKQRKHNEELMRNHEVATKDMVPTPATQGAMSQIFLFLMAR